MNKSIVYMAAGNSRRFGSNKLLHIYDGKPLYRHGLDMLISFCSHRTDCSLIVVSQYQEILRYSELKDVWTVYSHDSKKGVSFTIRAAIESLEMISEEDFIVFVVADQPYLSEKTMEKILEQVDRGVETVSAAYHEKPGNPTMFSAKLIPELLGLKGDEGGRKVIKNHKCIYVEVEEEKELYDIDVKMQEEGFL